MQKWEYTGFVRTREVSDKHLSSKVFEWDKDEWAELEKLGNEGWELVSVTPRSSMRGDSYAGTTTDELWVFKRPKP